MAPPDYSDIGDGSISPSSPVLSRLINRLNHVREENELFKRREHVKGKFIDALREASQKTIFIDELLSRMFYPLRELIRFERGSIIARSPNPLFKNTHNYVVVHEGIKEAGIEEKLLRTEDSRHISSVFQTGRSLFIDSSQRDYKTNSILVPLLWNNKVRGVLSVSDKISGKPFSKEDEFLLMDCINDLGYYIGSINDHRKKLEACAYFVEKKDSYTRFHQMRTGQTTGEILAKKGKSISEQWRTGRFSGLHDTGKVAVSKEILKKEGRLTEEEFNEIKIHPYEGEKALLEFIRPSDNHPGLQLIRNHHERWDGKGYPDGLGEEDIPEPARVLSVADAFDAMNSNRAYRQALPKEEILKRLKESRGSQLDPRIVDLFLDLIPDLAYGEVKEESPKIFHTPFCPEALRIPRKSFLVSLAVNFLENNYEPCRLCWK